MRDIRVALLVFGLVLLIAARGDAQDTTRNPAPAGPTPDLSRHENDIARFEAADRARKPEPGGVLFVGSSSFRLWPSIERDFPGLAVINRGFGGSTLPEVVHFAPRIVLPYRPRTIVVYAGDNDIASGRTPEQVASDYRRFVALVRRELPATRILFVALKPSPSRWRHVTDVREANRLVRRITESDSLQAFVDVFTPMLGERGRPRPELFVSDSLHMAPAGYALWRDVLARAIR